MPAMTRSMMVARSLSRLCRYADCGRKSLVVAGDRGFVVRHNDRPLELEVLQEGQERVGRSVATDLDLARCRARQSALFEGEVRVEVELSRANCLVTQEQRDNDNVDPGAEQGNRRRVPEHVGR